MGSSTLTTRIDVLDHGFVELLDIMGDDREPARAARISYSDGIERTKEQDMKLSLYLMEHGHWSPFEMVELKFRIKAPIFVARQLVRHRTANWNEFSMRYADPERIGEDGIDFYTPEEWRGPDPKNKQGSVVLGGDEEEAVLSEYRNVLETAEFAYKWLKGHGVANEMARMVLPTSIYTEWVWKCDLRNTWNLLAQRDHEGAQWETREYAKAMKELMTIELPGLMSLWGSTHE